jgi:hypothetical protein
LARPPSAPARRQRIAAALLAGQPAALGAFCARGRGQARSLLNGKCGKCGGQVTGWPYAVVVEPIGTSTYFHEGCEPWRHADVPLGAEDIGPVPHHWRPVIADLVDRLVVKDYAGLVREGLVSFTSDPDDTTVGLWIEDYPATLVALPEAAWDVAERGRWVHDPGAWWIVVPLWTAEEGRSDLSLEATVRELNGAVIVVVDQVHVM